MATTKNAKKSTKRATTKSASSTDKKLKAGDKVSWSSQQGEIKGTVKKLLTKPTKIKTHEVNASKENPEYLVESDKTGAQAAHKPAALKKRAK